LTHEAASSGVWWRALVTYRVLLCGPAVRDVSDGLPGAVAAPALDFILVRLAWSDGYVRRGDTLTHADVTQFGHC